MRTFIIYPICFSVLLLFPCTSKKTVDIVEVTAKDFQFEVRDEIPSGWTTFKFNNTGHAPHFFLLNKLPDSISFDAYHMEVTKPFENVFDSLKAGKSKEEAIGLLVSMIPSWYFTSVKQMGGTGIVDAGKVAQTTLKLEPGTYAMECYIKENGIFHTALGMIRPIKVTSDSSDQKPPDVDVDITLTNFKFESEGEIKRGLNTVAVHFKEQPEAGGANDIHLIKIEDSSDIAATIPWLNWMNIEGLQPPAPVEFLGGSQEMPVGYTSYFTVDLQQGNYAWIAESSADKGMVKTFAVE